MFLLQSNTPWQVADYWGHLLRSPGPALVSSLSTRYIIAFHWKCKQIWLIKKYSLKNKIFNYRNFYLLQPFPMYHISTTWMQVVPKLNPKGRDLLQVNIYTMQLCNYNALAFFFGSFVLCKDNLCHILNWYYFDSHSWPRICDNPYSNDRCYPYKIQYLIDFNCAWKSS